MKTRLLRRLRKEAYNKYRVVLEDRKHAQVQECWYDALVCCSCWETIYKAGPGFFLEIEEAKQECNLYRRNYILDRVKKLRITKRIY